MSIRPIILFTFLQLGLVGCSSVPVETAEQNPNQMNNLILAEPESADLRIQLAVARLTEMLGRAEMADEQKAELYYQRGVYYDSVGLNGMAMYDFNRAVQLNPTLSDAYNYLGIHSTQQMEFVEAYNYFDSTLEIDPENDFVFLNRGIALYYGGRPSQAIKDIDTYFEKDNSDPYRALWRYIVEHPVSDESARQRLAQDRESLDSANWATHLVDFYLGNLSEQDLLTRLPEGLSNKQELNNRLCEAYFYLGKFYSDQGNTAVASNYFKAALSTNVYDFVEHRTARLELDILRDERYQSAALF